MAPVRQCQHMGDVAILLRKRRGRGTPPTYARRVTIDCTMPNATAPDMSSDITDAEGRLREAMLASDLGVLAELIDHGLIFTNHLGQVFGKHDDLETHRSGLLKLARMDASEMRVHVDGDCAIVTVRMAVAGSFGPSSFGADLRYTRVWRRAPEGAWRVVAAHASEVR